LVPTFTPKISDGVSFGVTEALFETAAVGGDTAIFGIVAMEIFLDTIPETWPRFEAYADDQGIVIDDELDAGSITEEHLTAWFIANP